LKQTVLVKTGGTIEQIKSKHGDFEDWFAQSMGHADLLQIDVFRQQPLPPEEKLRAVVITGAAAMVSAREDWSERTARWLQRVVQKGIPVLGVCYGHQLLAHALGGRVGPNPVGRQIGTVPAQLCGKSKKDPLFAHLPDCFYVQTSHSEVVLELPPGAERLATSPLDDNFVIRFAENVWGVQFHPEFSRAVMMKYIQYRADDLCLEGLNPDELLAKTTETAEARTVLSRFAQMYDAEGETTQNTTS